jgi:hypothetical protein
MLTEFSAAMSGLKVAMEIGKGLAAVDKMMEQATLKGRVAELLSSLADAKIAITEAQGVFEQKDAEIRRLQDALANKAKVARVRNAYYELDAGGKPTGHPYCARCHEVDHRLVHLAVPDFLNELSTCPQCKAKFQAHTVHA